MRNTSSQAGIMSIMPGNTPGITIVANNGNVTPYFTSPGGQITEL